MPDTATREKVPPAAADLAVVRVRPARRGRELWYALAAIAAVTALYAVASWEQASLPRASSLIGHGIGVAGFALMLLAAVLYPLRKARADARWGSAAIWLRAHMVMGLVGPAMVFLHTGLKFSGLAGVAMVLTVVVAASGVVGRYLYTRSPRDGAAGGGRKALATWHLIHLPLTWALFAAAFIHVVAALYYATLQR